jgi:hypothetical protein
MLDIVAKGENYGRRIKPLLGTTLTGIISSFIFLV